MKRYTVAMDVDGVQWEHSGLPWPVAVLLRARYRLWLAWWRQHDFKLTMNADGP